MASLIAAVNAYSNKVHARFNTQDATIAGLLPKAGGTLLGPLTLASSPVNQLDAATKQYVDSHIGGGGGGGTSIEVKDEGTQVVVASALNYVGAGVQVTNNNGIATITIPGTVGGSSSLIVKSEGNTVTSSDSINFIGGGVSVTNVGGVATIDIPSSSMSRGGNNGVLDYSLINSQIETGISTSMSSSGITVASGHRVVIQSIHVVNTVNSECQLTARILYANGDIGPICLYTPFRAYTNLNIIMSQLVLQTGDTLQFQGNASGLQAVITYADLTDTTYFSSGKKLQTSDMTDIYVSASQSSIIESILLSETSGSLNGSITIAWADAANNILGYFAYNQAISNGSAIELINRVKYLPVGHKIRARSMPANSSGVIVSGKKV